MKKYVANVRIRKTDKNGSTYHDVQLISAESGIILNEVKKVYGYGDQYYQTTVSLINEYEQSHRIYGEYIDVIYIIHKY